MILIIQVNLFISHNNLNTLISQYFKIQLLHLILSSFNLPNPIPPFVDNLLTHPTLIFSIFDFQDFPNYVPDF